MVDYGSGVSRTLDANARQYLGLVWQRGKVPLDSELNLISQASSEALRQVMGLMPSGVIGDPTEQTPFRTNPLGSNRFTIDPFWANVNGWLIPVQGTQASDDQNVIRLNPPPSTGSRIDLVFLEAWTARIDANPSTLNKPSASTLWKYGNVEFGGTPLADDLKDPEKNVSTTGRVQIQYRIRVHGAGTGLGASVALDAYPNGLGDPSVLAYGPKSSALGSFAPVEGDSGLWRAGTGDASASGTIDGYVYAVPLCAVFRRSSADFLAVNNAGAPTLNGALDRTPSTAYLADPRTGARLLTRVTQQKSLLKTSDVMVELTLEGLSGSGFEDARHDWDNTYLRLGNEVISISGVNVSDSTITITGRGRYGTAATGHHAGEVLDFFSPRPDGLFADSISDNDLLDLRHIVSLGEWDARKLLEHNVAALLRGDLKTTWKVSSVGGSQGVQVLETSYLHRDATSTTPQGTIALDGPDGIRTIWSDAAVMQPEVTVLLDNTAPQDSGRVGLTNENRFTSGAGYAWDVGADLYPSGFLNTGGAASFNDGSSLFFFFGGRDGTGGARATFRDGSKSVRALAPQEFTGGAFHPVTLRFLDQRALEAPPVDLKAVNKPQHPGAMYPSEESGFTRPFIVLGGLAHSALRVSVPATDLKMVIKSGDDPEAKVYWVHEIDLGINFDAAGVWEGSDPANKLVHGTRTLYDLITKNGEDPTGAHSELFVVLYGDKDSASNNGAFRVVGAGAAGYYGTDTAANATSVRLTPLSLQLDFVSDTGNSVMVEFRTQYTHSEDTSTYDAKIADVVVVLTDVRGQRRDHPWNTSVLGADPTYDLTMQSPIAAPALVDFTLMYHPGRGGTSKVPNSILRFARRGAEASQGAYLRQSPGALDPVFVGAPTNETYWDADHIQLWNRMAGVGGVLVGDTEQDREHELLMDPGSKTILFRPMRDRRMTLQAMTWTSTQLNNRCLLGYYEYKTTAVQKDGLRIWTGDGVNQGGTGKRMGFVVPKEFMPRFGRQDIPFYRDTLNGTGAFLSGINHLFRDEVDVQSPVFHVIGGTPTSSGVPSVQSMLFATGGLTGATTGYSYGGADTMPGWVNQAFVYARRAPQDISPSTSYGAQVIETFRKVSSSDLGKGLKGIQLPPYHGIARLYGVYDARNYVAKSGRGFRADRVALEADSAKNLLREDLSQQTLYIMQDGGRDMTETTGDHTYVIPFSDLDITRSPNYTAGETPEDLHYIVECVVFGFARGFISENNLVLVRKFGGSGQSVSGLNSGNQDGDNPLLKGCHMVIPSAAAYNDQLYCVYSRVPYQGDPYMTRNAGSHTSTDIDVRRGQLSLANKTALRTPIEQYDSNGIFVPQTPNARGYEVLAALDFATSLGTGKIGGPLYEGTILDVGLADPETNVVRTGAFTERGVGTQAHLDLIVTRPASWSGMSIRISDPTSTREVNLNISGTDTWAIGGNETYNSSTSVNTVLLPGVPYTKDVTIPDRNGTVLSQLVVNPAPDKCDAWVTRVDNTTLRLTLLSHVPVLPFETLSGTNILTASLWRDATPIAAGAVVTMSVSVPGVKVGDTLVFHDATGNGYGGLAGLVFSGRVTSDDNLTVYIYNVTNNQIPGWGGTLDLKVGVLRDQDRVTGVSVTGSFKLSYVIGRLNAEGLSATQRAWLLADTLDGTIPSGPYKLKAYAHGNVVRLYAATPGAQGNQIKITLPSIDPLNDHGLNFLDHPSSRVAYLAGGTSPRWINAGDGRTPIDLMGMTERLPLGAALQDHDFIGEAPVGDSFWTQAANMGFTPVLLPLSGLGVEYSRFLGAPGDTLGLADATQAISAFGAWRRVSEGGGGPSGARAFRVYRGASAYNLTGKTPGAPLDWSIGALREPILKGGLLLCRALLVRNTEENVGEFQVSSGSEVQMILLTHGLLGDLTNLRGLISPSGFGEGLAAAERYRIKGHPLVRSKFPLDATVTLVPYPDSIPE